MKIPRKVSLILGIMFAIIFLFVIIQESSFHMDNYKKERIAVKEGDTLWTLAERYRDKADSVGQWIKEVELLNDFDSGSTLLEANKKIWIWNGQ